MPLAPLRYCLEPNCRALVRTGRCAAHAAKGPTALYDRARGTAAERGYGPAWRRLRGLVLHAEPLCRVCLADEQRPTIATHVDHLVPKAAGGTDDRRNLQALCDAHHRLKTAREGAAIRRGDYRPR